MRVVTLSALEALVIIAHLVYVVDICAIVLLAARRSVDAIVMEMFLAGVTNRHM